MVLSGKLKVWGSLSVASAAEPLYVAVEEKIRLKLTSNAAAVAVANAAAVAMKARARQAEAAK